MSDVSPMVANVPYATRQNARGRWFCEGDFQYVGLNQFGSGETEDEAIRAFFEAIKLRYMDLTVSEMHGALTESEVIELEYYRECRGQTDAESGDGARG